eukprot:826669-Rhodomonas_salina.1
MLAHYRASRREFASHVIGTRYASTGHRVANPSIRYASNGHLVGKEGLVPFPALFRSRLAAPYAGSVPHIA